MIILILVYLMSALWPATGFFFQPSVKTPLGKIEGIYSIFDLVPVKEYLGIPFAKPPVGSLRFLKTEPMEAWSGTLKANKQHPACMQYTEGLFPWYDNMTGKSEDCLYLDIYTPFYASKGSKLPVLFWVYGGGYTLGSNRLDVYDGRVLAKKEDVIVVTINYRLGLFGFLTSNTSDAPGNVALYDVVMALQWVNDNIEYFGGDKDRITISGESGGSSIVSILCVSPLTKGLFSRAILQSSSIINRKNNELDYNLNLTQRLAVAVNCATDNFTIYDHPTDVVQCLRNRNATYLTRTLSSFAPFSTASFYPQYGDSLLPHNALSDIRNGNFHKVPILSGVLRDEGSFFLATGHHIEFGFFGKKDPQVNKTYATTLLQSIFSNYTDPQKYIDFYLKDVPDDDYDLIRRQVYTAIGDTTLLCPAVFFSESYAERKQHVYFYFFTHRPSNTPWAEWMGVVHFEDVQFVFGRPVRVPKDYTAKEIWLSSQIMKIWGNFAKNGNPGAYLNWPNYSKENHTYLTLNISNFGSLGTGPHLENCNFLRSYFGF
ncbi:Acetylcholinesterase-1 like protein [Argiope bruennichi]|uniref:Carboxylic ester hydrolase n=1 Tax=Argiope bruennichi TaxID=94029 RepID=A0A8T0EJC1_ARGBR|nr:Acetylcholinesterase-1 like protein [Argiope bruennichi]